MKSARRKIEFLLLYGAMPVLLWALRGRVPVFPVLWAAACLALWALLRDPAFDRASLVAWRGDRPTCLKLAMRFAFSALVVALIVLCFYPGFWLRFPRERPALWLMVMLLYPLLSVVPQGVLYRSLFYHRYAPLFGQALAARAAGALSFAWCHMIFHNWWAVLFSFLGGWFFCGTYEKTRSGLISNFEHALYGCMIFTSGLGIFFYLGRNAAG